MTFTIKKQKGQKGFSVVELLLVVFFITISITALIAVAGFSLSLSIFAEKTIQADSLAKSLLEITRSFRDGTNWGVDGLGALNSGTDYYFQKSGSPVQWVLTAGQEQINGFTRKVVFSDVFRDADDNIVADGGIFDPDAKKATVIVSWQERERTHQVLLEAYFTNW